MTSFEKSIRILITILDTKKDELADGKFKNFFCHSLRSVIMLYEQFVKEDSKIDTSKIDDDVKNFTDLSLKFLENKDFCNNYGNYGALKDQILALVDANGRIYDLLKKSSFFSRNGNVKDTNLAFTANMIKFMDLECKSALEKENELRNTKNSFISSITNETCWMYWLNNHISDISVSLEELSPKLNAFLEKIFDFKLNDKMFNCLESHFSHGGNFSLEYMNSFFEHFANVTLFNKIRQNDLSIFPSEGKNKNEKKETAVPLRLVITGLPDEDSSAMPKDYFKKEDHIILNYPDLPIYKFENKSVVNPAVSLSDSNVRFGRDHKERPHVSVWFNEMQQTVSRKQLSIDYNEKSFGITCISASNPTLFKLMKDQLYPLECDSCFQLSDTEVFVVRRIELGKGDGTMKKKLVSSLITKSEIKPNGKLIEGQQGTIKKNIGKPKEKEKERKDLGDGIIALITLEFLPLFRRDENLPKTHNFLVIENKGTKDLKYYRIDNNFKDRSDAFPAITIGRKADSAICLTYEQVSSEHCEIFFDYFAAKFWIKEKKPSTNGTFMFLKTLTQFESGQFSDRYDLHPGIVISVDGVQFEAKN